MTTPPDNDTERDLEPLLEYLKRARGFDFTAYKRTSLTRRLQKRMETLGIASYPEYLDHLEVHPDEFGHLFNTILINVTGFFRDEQAWEYLRESIVPEIIKSKRPDDQIRVWSAGCASGEEAYSLAMVFDEILGAEPFHRRTKIYATDANEAALTKARQATYTEREVEDVPAELRSKYFTQTGGSYVVDPDLRRQVVFGRHDLIADSPISRIDLILCRNTLMYFNSETQSRILQRLHFALSDGGFLMLGKAEMLLTTPELFAPVDLKRRVVRKVSRPSAGNRAWFLYPSGQRSGDGRPHPDVHAPGGGQTPSDLREAAMRTAPLAFVLIDADGRLVLANEQARELFTLTPDDNGRSLTELSVYYRPVELHAHLEQARVTGGAVVLPEIEWGRTPTGEPRCFEVAVAPLIERSGTHMGFSITFTDITQFRSLEHNLRESNQALETAQEELQTTNEELQSTVEELETTNEELQSTNEELETMNEELQSTNEELRTSNDELRQRSDQLDHMESFWGSVIGGLPAGMIVLDHESRVQVWNARAEDLWGLRADEVRGKHFLGLDIGLPVERLKTPIREAQGGNRPDPVVLMATNRRGRTIRIRVELTPIPDQPERLRIHSRASEDGGSGTPHGCLVLMQELPDERP